jgi:hypothetical protein
MRVEGMTVKCSQHVRRLGKGRRTKSFPTNQGHHIGGNNFINDCSFDSIPRILHVYLESHMVIRARLHIRGIKLD